MSLDMLDMCGKHEVRFFKGACDICLMLETIDLSRRMFDLTKDALNNGKLVDAHSYIDAALKALPKPLEFECADRTEGE